MGAVELKKKVNIKQDPETVKVGTGGLKVSGTKSSASRNHTAFIVLLRMTSSGKGVVGAGYRGFFFIIL